VAYVGKLEANISQKQGSVQQDARHYRECGTPLVPQFRWWPSCFLGWDDPGNEKTVWDYCLTVLRPYLN
tara:strand:+ start:3772 stop:3978 length:207 start_codon:yes stop_codon:yes gene_type:complete